MATKDGKKTGGRQRGAKNKRSKEAAEVLQKEDFDALKTMVRLCRQAEADGDLAEAARLAIQIVKYQYPALKAIEHSTTGGGMNIVWSTGVPEGQPSEPELPTPKPAVTADDVRKLIEGG